MSARPAARSPSWPASFAVALLAAVAGAFAAGGVAVLAVDWYGISSFEGGSGYFVVAVALLGVVVGFVVGLVVARLVAAGARPGFVRAQLLALATVGGLALAAGGTARAFADVPPTLDGEPLLLAVEVRWPAGQPLPAASDTSDARLSLLSVGRFSHRARGSRVGPLWRDEARQEDGHWIVPGAVELFTDRGLRVLVVEADPGAHVGVELPLPASPGPDDRAWSPWLPRGRPGAAAPPGGVTFRYRVRRRSEPVRVERFGPFGVDVAARAFHADVVDGRTVVVTTADLTVRHRGAPVPVTGVLTVAAVSAPRAALLVVGAHGDGGMGCQLVVDDGPRVRIARVADCDFTSAALPVTADTARVRAARTRHQVPGTVDRTTFAAPGLYLVQDALLDTRTLTVRRLPAEAGSYPVTSVPALAVAPDGRSFVRYTERTTGARSQLTVYAMGGDGHYSLPVDTVRMPFRDLDALDAAWLARHFAWRRGPDGVDRLVARAAPAP